jgi:hypothetical protein
MRIRCWLDVAKTLYVKEDGLSCRDASVQNKHIAHRTIRNQILGSSPSSALHTGHSAAGCVCVRGNVSVHAMKVCVGVEVSLHSFLNSKQDG